MMRASIAKFAPHNPRTIQILKSSTVISRTLKQSQEKKSIEIGINCNLMNLLNYPIKHLNLT